jgi:nucleotide-binding universal stress UspA family protein
MKMKRVLHPTDFSPNAYPAFLRSLEVCRTTGAELHLLHVTESLGDDPIRGAFESKQDDSSFHKRIFDRADTEMKKLAAEAEAQGVKVKRVHARGGAPGDIILEYDESERPDLIVMGTHGRRGMRRMLAGSVASEVVRFAQNPVMTVPAKTKRWAGELTRILVPVDYSIHAKRSLVYASELAAAFEASLHILHVIEKPVFPAFYDASVEMMFGNVEAMIEESHQELERMLDDIEAPRVSTRIEVIQGHAVEAILDTAETRNCDLIVLSTHGLTGVSRFLIGSVSERVIRSAHTPTLRLQAIKDRNESQKVPVKEAQAAM